jgi:hypothetical protein
LLEAPGDLEAHYLATVNNAGRVLHRIPPSADLNPDAVLATVPRSLGR